MEDGGGSVREGRIVIWFSSLLFVCVRVTSESRGLFFVEEARGSGGRKEEEEEEKEEGEKVLVCAFTLFIRGGI